MNRTSAQRRLNLVWLVLVGVTLATWLLSSAGAHASRGAERWAAVGVLSLAVIKVVLVIENFMEVRAAPRWLRVTTAAWAATLWAGLLALYLA
jgi:hypothetical protein